MFKRETQDTVHWHLTLVCTSGILSQAIVYLLSHNHILWFYTAVGSWLMRLITATVITLFEEFCKRITKICLLEEQKEKFSVLVTYKANGQPQMRKTHTLRNADSSELWPNPGLRAVELCADISGCICSPGCLDPCHMADQRNKIICTQVT